MAPNEATNTSSSGRVMIGGRGAPPISGLPGVIDPG